MLRQHGVLQTCNAAHILSATSERVASKPRLDPILCPWLIKYGGKSGFSLSNSVMDAYWQKSDGFESIKNRLLCDAE